jgi:hypothetical protein
MNKEVGFILPPPFTPLNTPVTAQNTPVVVHRQEIKSK